MKPCSGSALLEETHPEALLLPGPGASGASAGDGLDAALCFSLAFFLSLNTHIFIYAVLRSVLEGPRWGPCAGGVGGSPALSPGGPCPWAEP